MIVTSYFSFEPPANRIFYFFVIYLFLVHVMNIKFIRSTYNSTKNLLPKVILNVWYRGNQLRWSNEPKIWELNCEQQKIQHPAPVCVSSYIKISLLMGSIPKWETLVSKAGNSILKLVTLYCTIYNNSSNQKSHFIPCFDRGLIHSWFITWPWRPGSPCTEYQPGENFTFNTLH